MRLKQYDFNFGAYENIKSQVVADRLAKNRWGLKFKELYMRHMETTGNGTIGNYNFTRGMRASVTTITQSQTDLAATTNLKNKLLNGIQVDVGSGFSINGALQNSYASVLIEAVQNPFNVSTLPHQKIIGIHFSLSLADGTSWFYSSGTNDSTPCVDYESGTNTGENHNTILNSRGVEDRTNASFKPNQDALFASMWTEMSDFLGLMVDDFVPAVIGNREAVVVPLSSLLYFLDSRVTVLIQTIDQLTNGVGRIEEDLELINYLGIADTLYQQIDNPSKIGDIWFMFERDITPQMIDNGIGILIPDPNYEWWKEQQFQTRVENGVKIPGIADKVKNFQNYCVMEGSKVYVKLELLDTVGYDIYWFVNTFLGIDASAKKTSLLARIFNFVLLIVSISLTAISANPVWLKIALIGTSVMSYSGVLSPELSLFVAALSFGYGLSQVDFSAMNSVQIFSWTINNIEMVGKMLNLYKNIGIQKNVHDKAKEKNKNKNLAQLQDGSMQFIYSRAYSQYDDLYNMLYDFSPQYKT